MRTRLLLLALFFLLIHSNTSFATVYYSNSDGDWQDSDTWNPAGIPGEFDDVIIDGHTVTINAISGDITVKSVTLSNSSLIDHSELIVDGEVFLTISDDLISTLGNFDKGIEIQIINDALVNVEGDVNFTRLNDNVQNDKLYLKIQGNSELNISGNFTFDYNNSAADEAENEILLSNNARLEVNGNIYLFQQGGNDFDVKLQNTAQFIAWGTLNVEKTSGNKFTLETNDNSYFQVLGDVTTSISGGNNPLFLHANGSSGRFTFAKNLTMISGTEDQVVYMEATNNDCVIDVRGNITMSAMSPGDVYIDLKASSDMFMGGSFIRPTNYGSLLMNSDATLTYNGNNPQVIAQENTPGSLSDAFNYTNIVMNNASGFSLESEILVKENLSLSNGNIKTTEDKKVIIDDQATITGGSETAYIDGPMKKIGRSNGLPFVFPIGDGAKYAPLEISKITEATAEFTARYDGDPPPFGNDLTSDLTTISQNEFWTLNRSVEVDVVLHWTDATASDIFNLDSLVVVGLTEANVWESYGNGGTTGGVGPNVGGSVSSMEGDPPPFGSLKFTFGAVSERNSESVDLTRFTAIQHSEQVELEWQAATELNTSHYIVEHSYDGIQYSEVETIMSRGEMLTEQVYVAVHESPYYGLNYYRLKIVEKDSAFTYSEFEIVRFEMTPTLIIYPNPVRSIIQLKATDWEDGESKVEVFDRNGVPIFNGMILFENGQAKVLTSEINVIEPGTYILRITKKPRSEVLKFIKLDLK